MISEIIKRDGRIQEFDPEKMNHWSKWAAPLGVDWFAVSAKAYEKCPEKCTTKDLLNAQIQTCLEYEDEPHMLMAGRLYMGDVYKQAFGGHKNIPTVKKFYHDMVAAGLWEDMGYTDEELDQAEAIIDHEADLKCPHSQVAQTAGKYALKDIATGRILESPAFVWIGMALRLGMDAPDKMQEVAKYYKDFAEDKLNAPTPNNLNLRTPRRNYASCCVFKSNDELASLAAGDHIAYTMTGAAAGVGGTLFTRTKGDGVRRNTIKHKGKQKYYEASQAAVHANTQAGRGGALTMHASCLDPEIFHILRMRHPTTPPENRVDGIDYSFCFHPYLAEKAANREKWMLLSLKNAPEVYAAMYSGVDGAFEKAYDEYEAGKGKRVYVEAFDLVKEYLTVREETNRLYENNTFEMNYHTPFKDAIYSSNLC